MLSISIDSSRTGKSNQPKGRPQPAFGRKPKIKCISDYALNYGSLNSFKFQLQAAGVQVQKKSIHQAYDFYEGRRSLENAG